MNPQLFDVVNKSSAERIEVRLVNYHGRDLIDMRSYYLNDDGDWKPTKKGLSLTPDTFKELAAVLNKVSEDL